MAPSGRSFIALAAAIVLPTLMFASLQIAAGFRSQSDAIENASLERAQRIIGAVDARLNGVRAALGVMTTIRSLDSRDWREAYQRVQEIVKLDAGWKSVRLIEVETSRQIFDTRHPLSEPFIVEASPSYDPAKVISVGDALLDLGGCSCVSVVAVVLRDGKPRYLFVLALGTDEFQAMTLATAPSEGVTAIVDAKGAFVSRTRAYEERVGRPSSTYVREAIRSGDRGVYQGVTLEGLANFTGFVKSPETGWSAHVAVSSSVLDKKTRGWWTATAAAALASFALAGAMAWFGLRALAEQRKAAERMEQSARAEAIAKLAGGMAHDFNNMLTIVLGSLEIMRRRLAAGRTDVMRYVDNATEGATRAADLTRKMLAFSRRELLEPRSIDVNDLVAEMRELFARTLPANIRILLALETRWNVRADPRHLENALLNLVVNARDAMPAGGELTIATRDAPAGGKTSRDLVGDAVEIVVRDSGEGMTETVAAQAFEPFFTTKDVGRGTGLGLSQVYGFARQSGGRVTLKSRPGEGAEVTILLPRASEAAAPSQRRTRFSDLPAGHADEVVLVVEDEERVLKSTVETLRELGYTVRHAGGGAAALDILRTQPNIRLLFTDIMMPGVGGRELASRASDLRPDLKVLFATGFERDPSPSDPRGRVLAKPYTLEELARSVREMLDG